MKCKLIPLVCCQVLITMCFFQGYSQSDTSKQTELTFDQALKVSLENNLGIKEASTYSKMKQEDMKSTKSLYLPTVTLSASWIRMSDDIHLDLNPVKEAITPLYSALGNYGNFSDVPNPNPATNTQYPTLPDNISTSVVRENLLEGLEEIEAANWDQIIQKKDFGFINAGFSYPLYAGGKIRCANKASLIQYNEALNEENLKQSSLITELAERYYGFVLSNEALKVRNSVLQTMQKHLYDAKRLKEEGQLSNAEYLHVQVLQSEAERELKKTQLQVNLAKESLLNTLGLNDSSQITPVSLLFITDSIEPLSYFLEKANQESELLQKVNHKKELAQLKYKIEKSNFFPSIAAMGTYDLANKDLSPYLPEYTVGIGMKWELFSGASRFRKLNSAKLQQEQVDFVYSKTTSDIHLAITKYYQEMNLYQEQLNDLKTAYAFANEYFRVRNKAFLEGMSTASEVSDANLSLAKVKIDMLQSMYSFDLALSKLLYYTGIAEEFNNYQLSGTAYSSFINSLD